MYLFCLPLFASFPEGKCWGIRISGWSLHFRVSSQTQSRQWGFAEWMNLLWVLVCVFLQGLGPQQSRGAGASCSFPPPLAFLDYQHLDPFRFKTNKTGRTIELETTESQPALKSYTWFVGDTEQRGMRGAPWESFQPESEGSTFRSFLNKCMPWKRKKKKHKSTGTC